MLVKWAISVSVATRSPALARSALPVNSSTHSRMTDGRVPSELELPWILDVAPGLGDLAVVMTSSLWGDDSVFPALLVSSGSARFVRRGARREPTRGNMKRAENRTIEGGRRYVLRPAMSERYICPVIIPITATAADPGKRLSASCRPPLRINASYWFEHVQYKPEVQEGNSYFCCSMGVRRCGSCIRQVQSWSTGIGRWRLASMGLLKCDSIRPGGKVLEIWIPVGSPRVSKQMWKTKKNPPNLRLRENKNEHSLQISCSQTDVQFAPQRCIIIVLRRTSRLNLRKPGGEWIDANTRRNMFRWLSFRSQTLNDFTWWCREIWGTNYRRIGQKISIKDEGKDKRPTCKWK